jgi:hypothetical protein
LKKPLRIGKLVAQNDPGRAFPTLDASRGKAKIMTNRIPAALVAFAFGLGLSQACAGPIEYACMSSGRSEANPAVCGCVQHVADLALDGSDQRRAAKFFRNPELAHKVMMSDSSRDDAFWARWEAFGAQAELYCAG